jgi:hypothetical protein
MATLKSYVERMPQMYQSRYGASYWVGWANALLERLSGSGTLPPQHLVRGAAVRHGVWIDRPPMCRDVKEIRLAGNQSVKFRFAEENNRLRLMDRRFPEADRRTIPILDSTPSGLVLSNDGQGLKDGSLDNWLFVATSGGARGHTFIVSGSHVSGAYDSLFMVSFFDAPDWNPSDINAETPQQIQNSFYVNGEEQFADGGYFVSPNEYLIISYIAKFDPLFYIADDLGIGEYDNLIDAWLNWKVQEQVSSISSECAYYRHRVDEELAQIRGEKSNRVNPPRGRRLAGFM